MKSYFRPNVRQIINIQSREAEFVQMGQNTFYDETDRFQLFNGKIFTGNTESKFISFQSSYRFSNLDSYSIASFTLGLGEEHTIHKRSVFSSWLLFTAFFGLRATMNRFGAMFYWLVAKDIENARLMKHYFYTSGTTQGLRKSNKVGNFSTN